MTAVLFAGVGLATVGILIVRAALRTRTDEQE